MFRAVSSKYARRIVTRLSILIGLVIIVASIGTALLMRYVSPWWGILFVPIGLGLIVFLVLRAIIGLLIKRLYNENLSAAQTEQINTFIDKLERLFEHRQLTPPLLALVSVKDLLVHRELRTIRRIIDDSKTLGADLSALNHSFNHL